MAARLDPFDSSIHEMGRPVIYGVLRDVGGQTIDVAGIGADPTGTVDSKGAIDTALTQAGATTPPGTVRFPPGRFKTTGGHVIPTGVAVRGSGMGATTIDLAHASNDLFTFSAAHSNHLELSDFRVLSSVVRTGGWVFKGRTDFFFSVSRIDRVFIQNQVNGIWIPKFNYSWVSDVMMDTFVVGSLGTGLRLGQPAATAQGAGLHVSGVEIADFALGCSVGILIEDCDAVYMYDSTAQAINNAIKISAGTYGVHNCEFFGVVADQTLNSHAFYVTGAGEVGDTKFIGCRFSYAGGAAGSTGANGLRIDAAITNIRTFILNGCNFALNRGTGLYISTNIAPILVNGCNFARNGGGGAAANKDSIFVNTGTGERAPHLVGNFCNGVLAGGEFSIRTSATTDQLTVVGNRWVSGTGYGVAPLTNTANT